MALLSHRRGTKETNFLCCLGAYLRARAFAELNVAAVHKLERLVHHETVGKLIGIQPLLQNIYLCFQFVVGHISVGNTLYLYFISVISAPSNFLRETRIRVRK